MTATAAFRNEPLLTVAQASDETDVDATNLASHAALGARLLRDRSGIAATEFAVIVPLMLVMFFGTVEFSSGVAVDRKVTLMARTLSDLTSQIDLGHRHRADQFFAASNGIMTPYSSTPTQATITEFYVDPTTQVARVQWSKGVTRRAAARNARSTIPTALQVGGTYLIFSEVSYKYVPAVGYVMAKAGIKLSDVTYTRPRQSTCVMYNTSRSARRPTRDCKPCERNEPSSARKQKRPRNGRGLSLISRRIFQARREP